MTTHEPSRLRWQDLASLGVHGLRARPGRTVLSALGVAIGIAAMIAVVAISASSRALVDRELAALGTNMLSVSAGQSLTGEEQELPVEAPDAIANIPGVEAVTWVAALTDVHVYRNAYIDPGATGGISVSVAQPGLLDVVGAQLAAGRWHDAGSETVDTVVLGDAAATHLGVRTTGQQVLLGGRPYTVIGILQPVKLAESLDLSVFIGAPVATAQFEFEGHPTRIFERSAEDLVEQVSDRLGRTAMPEDPSAAEVDRPSDALAAKEAVDTAFSGLLVGVGSVALVVGGIGVANTMVISVLERRVEIGLRRSLGATRRHIALQFLTEAVLLAGIGGLGGILLGIGIGVVTALARGWPPTVPPLAIGAAVAATVVVGGIAGALPAMRASRTPPTVVMAA